MNRTAFFGVGDIRSKKDVDHLVKSIQRFRKEGKLFGPDDQAIVVMGGRDLNNTGYQIVKSFMEHLTALHIKISACIPKGVISIAALSSLAGASTIYVEDGVSVDLDVDPSHDSYNDHKSFYNAFMAHSVQPFVSEMSGIVNSIKEGLVDSEKSTVLASKSIKGEIFRLQMMSDEEYIINPPGQELIEGSGISEELPDCYDEPMPMVASF